MDVEAAKLVGAGLATLGFIGPGVGIGLIWAALINSVGRNRPLPEPLPRRLGCPLRWLRRSQFLPWPSPCYSVRLTPDTGQLIARTAE